MSQIIKNLASGPVPPSVATLYTENTGTATPAANNLNVVGGTGIATSGFGDTITINVINGGFTWIETAISLGITAQVGVFCTAALTISLPPSGSLSIGATVIVYVDTTDPVVIQANAGQSIEISQNLSSVAGTATSTTQGNIVTLVFRPSDTTWHAISSAGSFTLA